MLSSELLRRRFHCDPSAPQLAREAVRALDDLAAVRDDAVLIVSELVTNAVRHSGADEAEELELTIELTGAGVAISVWDVGRSDSAPKLAARRAEPGGLGLHVVAALAARWGAEEESGWRVWAELPL